MSQRLEPTSSERSEETSSNVCHPGPGCLDVRPSDRQKLVGDAMEVRLDDRPEIDLAIGMGPDNQTFDHPGAQVTLQVGTRTTHSITSRLERKRTFGDSSPGLARSPVAPRKGASTVRIEGKAGKEVVSRSITITATLDKEAARQLLRSQEYLKRCRTERTNERRGTLAQLERWLERGRAELAGQGRTVRFRTEVEVSQLGCEREKGIVNECLVPDGQTLYVPPSGSTAR